MMPTSIAELEASALLLAPEDRAHLADRLLASLSSDTDLDDAWPAEAARRLTEPESGAVIGVPIAHAIACARDAIEPGRLEW